MERQRVLDLKKSLCNLNEVRRRYWTGLRDFRNNFLTKYPPDKCKNDPDWQDIYQTISDLWESQLKEETRRRKELLPSSCLSFCPECGQTIPPNDPLFVERENPQNGLYKSSCLCKICGSPLTGRQRDYCSEGCRSKARSRKWRSSNPEKKEKANLKYLKDIYEER